MMKLRVGDLVSSVRLFAEQNKNYGVVTYVPSGGGRVQVCWNDYKHPGIRPIAHQVITNELPEQLILEEPVDTSERVPEWDEISPRHHRSRWLKDDEESTVDILQIGDEHEWNVRINSQGIFAGVKGGSDHVKQWAATAFKQMGFKQV